MFSLYGECVPVCDAFGIQKLERCFHIALNSDRYTVGQMEFFTLREYFHSFLCLICYALLGLDCVREVSWFAIYVKVFLLDKWWNQGFYGNRGAAPSNLFLQSSKVKFSTIKADLFIAVHTYQNKAHKKLSKAKISGICFPVVQIILNKKRHSKSNLKCCQLTIDLGNPFLLFWYSSSLLLWIMVLCLYTLYDLTHTTQQQNRRRGLPRFHSLRKISVVFFRNFRITLKLQLA